MGDQLATSGPYSDGLSGVCTGKEKLDAGVYLLVVSTWEVAMGQGLGWEVKVWSDGPLSAALCT